MGLRPSRANLTECVASVCTSDDAPFLCSPGHGGRDEAEVNGKIDIPPDLSEAVFATSEGGTAASQSTGEQAASKKKGVPKKRAKKSKRKSIARTQLAESAQARRFRVSTKEKIFVFQDLDSTNVQPPAIEKPEIPDLGWPQQRHFMLPPSGETLRGWLRKRKARAALHPQAALGTFIPPLAWAWRFFELLHDQLVYWEFGDGRRELAEPPRGAFPLAEVDGVAVRGRDLTLHFSSPLDAGVRQRSRTQLRLRCAHSAEAEKWGAAVRAAAASNLREKLPAEWDVAAMLASNTPAVKMVAEVPLPDGWSVAMQRLLDHAYLFKRTKDRMNQELPVRLDVQSVIGVQNFAAWRKYAKARDRLSYKLTFSHCDNCEAAKLEPRVLTATHEDPIIQAALGETAEDANEHWLFHGTSVAGIQGIVNKDFTLDLAGSHRGTLYGKGLYLAECSTKADEYAEEDEAGLCRMLVCRVALGRILVDDSVKPNADELIDQVKVGYDSLCGDRWAAVGTYREFVLFNQELVYPAYIVSYRRTRQSELLSAFGAAASRGETEEAAKRVLQASRLAQTHADPVVRYRVSMLLGAQVSLVAPVLVAALRDARPHLRRTAAFMLGQLGSHTASAMTVSIEPPDDPVRKALAVSAVPALTQSLRDQNVEVRRVAAMALTQFGSHAASSVPVLVQRLRDTEEHERVREEAGKTLGHLGTQLTRVIADLPTLADILASNLSDASPYIRRAVATALGQIGYHAVAAVPALAAHLGDNEEQVRTACATALGSMPASSASSAIPGLVGCLTDESVDVRTAAASALGRLGEAAASALEALLLCFQDESARVRKAAVGAIGQLGAGAAPAAKAVAIFLKDPAVDHDIRVTAATAIGRMGSVAAVAVPMLRATLKDTSDELRKASVAALSHMGASATPALSGLTERIKDTNADVRKAASLALATLGRHAASQLPALQDFSEDPEQDVRDVADAARRAILYQMSLLDGGGTDVDSDGFAKGESSAHSSDGSPRS